MPAHREEGRAMSYRQSFKRQYQRMHIARSYATKWRHGDAADFDVFIATVNNDFAGEPWSNWTVTVNARRRTVILSTAIRDYRATLKPGTLVPAGDSWAPITAIDVEKFEYRPQP
jgi:hypothetical protein